MNDQSRYIRWVARITSLAAIAVFALFFFSGNEQQHFGDSSEMLGFAFFPVGLIIGFLVAWKWEPIGGAVSLVSLAAFYLWHYSRSGDFPSGPWFLIFASPAFLFLSMGLLNQKTNHSKSTNGMGASKAN